MCLYDKHMEPINRTNNKGHIYIKIIQVIYSKHISSCSTLLSAVTNTMTKINMVREVTSLREVRAGTQIRRVEAETIAETRDVSGFSLLAGSL